MKNTAFKKIFISYRVQDTAGETGRLVDALKQRFADEQIFMDIENLEPGIDFTEAIEKSLVSCDVLLAVIGPHWIGNRGGNVIRINDPNDWVRLEVTTALRRNIRVVPVLVDGASLPASELLPEDLQPLLRRQTIEISNKRWRYDTEQLIQFLINSAGIIPMRSVQQTAAPAVQEVKRKKTWLYVAAGFLLAFVVLIVIAALLPEEGNEANTADQTEQTVVPKNTLPIKSESTVDPSGLQTTDYSNKEVPTEEANISGAWKEIDEGETSTFILTQNGKRLTLQVELLGQMISTGYGEINQKNIDLHFNLLGMPTDMNATLSDDGNSIHGKYTVQSDGSVKPILLKRK